MSEPKKYQSLKDIYLNKSFAKPLPPLPRQTINWLMEAVADAPPQPDSAYVQLYIKDPSKEEHQFVGNIDVDYFNKVVKPVLGRGSESSISINRLVEKRLSDSNITSENLNIIFDFIQSTKMQISPENFSSSQGAFKMAIASQSPFNIAKILSESFNTSLDNITSHSKALTKLMQLRALDSSASHADQSRNAGPGEVVLAFFGNGRKLYISKTEEGRGDVALGDMFIEVKGTEGRVHPGSKKKHYSKGTAHRYTQQHFNDDPIGAVKYSVFGDEGFSISDFDNEITQGLEQKIDPRILATGLALREYQAKSGFNYYMFLDKNTFNAIGLNCTGKNIVELGTFYKTYLGNSHLEFSHEGHQLPKKFKIS